MFFPPIFWPTPKLPSHFPCTEHPDTGVKLGIKVLNAPCSSILRPSPGPGVHLEVEWFSKGKSAGNWKPGSLPSKHSSLVLPCTNSGVTGLLPWLAYTVIPLHYSLWAYDQCCNQWILGLPANPPKPTQPSKNWMNGNLQKTPTLEAKTMVSCRCSFKPIYWNPSCITFCRSRHSQPAGVPASGPPPFAACCAHAPASCASKGQRSAGGKWGAAVGWTSISGRPLAPWTIKVGCLVGWWVGGLMGRLVGWPSSSNWAKTWLSRNENLAKDDGRLLLVATQLGMIISWWTPTSCNYTELRISF